VPPQSKVRSIPLLWATAVLRGQGTAVFKRQPVPELEVLSFSLVYNEGYVTAGVVLVKATCVVCLERQDWLGTLFI
jgi:hypothetical protein